VGARGRFIFADCVVRNRGAIIEPWKEFKREGNSLFLCRLAVGFIFLALLAVASLPIWWSLARHGEVQYGWSFFVEVALLVSVFAAALVVWAMVSTFLVPIMYRRRCGAFHGCQEALGLITSAPGPIILFFLFGIVLALAIALSTCAVTCATCCIALIPYVGTVILLPVYVFWMSYVLLFLRQFGPAYDVWENLPPIALSTPPIQTSPPTPEPPPLPTG
jgi:hypothetical protein